MFGKVMNAPLRNLLNVFKKYLHKYQIKEGGGGVKLLPPPLELFEKFQKL